MINGSEANRTVAQPIEGHKGAYSLDVGALKQGETGELREGVNLLKNVTVGTLTVGRYSVLLEKPMSECTLCGVDLSNLGEVNSSKDLANKLTQGRLIGLQIRPMNDLPSSSVSQPRRQSSAITQPKTPPPPMTANSKSKESLTKAEPAATPRSQPLLTTPSIGSLKTAKANLKEKRADLRKANQSLQNAQTNHTNAKQELDAATDKAINAIRSEKSGEVDIESLQLLKEVVNENKNAVKTAQSEVKARQYQVLGAGVNLAKAGITEFKGKIEQRGAKAALSMRQAKNSAKGKFNASMSKAGQAISNTGVQIKKNITLMFNKATGIDDLKNEILGMQGEINKLREENESLKDDMVNAISDPAIAQASEPLLGTETTPDSEPPPHAGTYEPPTLPQ